MEKESDCTECSLLHMLRISFKVWLVGVFFQRIYHAKQACKKLYGDYMCPTFIKAFHRYKV